jgi:hypothetical protein
VTTLELAHAIATAVLAAARPRGAAPYGDAPTQAVLQTLHAHDAWFCRCVEDDVLGTVETPYEPVQLSFRFHRSR